MGSAADARTMAPWSPDVEHILDNLPVAVFRMTARGEVVYANRETAKLLGYGAVRNLFEATTLSDDDRHVLFAELSTNGEVSVLPLYWRTRGDNPILCAVSARAGTDETGERVADGVLRPVWGGVPERSSTPITRTDGQIRLVLDPGGKILDINPTGAALFQMDQASLIGRPVHEVILPVYQDLVALFLDEILQGTRRRGRMTVRDGSGMPRTIEFAALLVNRPGGETRIRCTAQESSAEPDDDGDGDERLRLAREIAGGLAHHLNQPLTILDNLVQELLSKATAEDAASGTLGGVSRQVAKLNEIVAKLSNITRYEVMDYLAGQRILDIESAS